MPHLISGARVANPASRNILEKCGLPVERRRTAPLRGAGLLDPGRPLPPDARRLVVAEELGEFDETGAVVPFLILPGGVRDEQSSLVE